MMSQGVIEIIDNIQVEEFLKNITIVSTILDKSREHATANSEYVKWKIML